MPLLLANDRNISHAAALLKEGKVVAFPTETVYGLGADASNPIAVAKIFEVKGRPLHNPLILHFASRSEIIPWVKEMPIAVSALLAQFSPGPFTILLPRSEKVPDIVTAGLDRVAVRIPSHPVARSLIQKLGNPIAAPSANRFQSISPTTAAHVEESLGSGVDLILDGGPCTVGLESTIVGYEGEQLCVYRLGGLSLEEIEAKAGPVQLITENRIRPDAPGMLEAHYAPKTPLYFGMVDPLPEGRGAKLCLQDLSPTLDLKEAAVRLYDAMRKLDRVGLDWIIAEPFPDQGLGMAINDRLRRASKRS